MSDLFLGGRKCECVDYIDIDTFNSGQSSITREEWINALCKSCFDLLTDDLLSGRTHKRALRMRNKIDNVVRRYFITLTETDEDPNGLIDRFNNVVSHLKCNYVFAYLELTKSGLPHIHMYVQVDPTVYIRNREIFRLNDKKRVDVQLVKNPAAVKAYVSKEGDPRLPEYVEKWDIEHKWEIGEKIGKI